MFGLSMDFMIGFVLGVFLSAFIGNKAFRQKLLSMFNKQAKGAPNQNKGDNQKRKKETYKDDDYDGKDIHIHLHNR